MNVFGLEIGAHSIKIAQIEKQWRGHSVKKLLYAPLAAGIGGPLASMGFDPGEDAVAVIYPQNLLSCRALELPFADRKRIEEVLPFELESLTVFDAGQLVCGFSDSPAPDGKTRVLAVMTPKEELAKFLGGLAEAGIDPDYVIPLPFALAESTGHVSASGGGTALVDAGMEFTTIVIMESGKPVFVHTAEPAADAAVAREDDKDGRKEFAKTVACSVYLAAEAARRKAVTQKVAGALVCGEPGADAKFVQWLGEDLGMPSGRVNLPDSAATAQVEGLKAGSSAGPVFAGALGAALLAVKGGGMKEINLRKNEFRKKRGFTGGRRHVLVAMALAGVLAVSMLAAYIAEGISLSAKYDGLKGQVRAEFQKAMPEVTNIVSEISQLKGALDAMEKQAGALGSAVGERDPFLERFYGITSSAPEGARLDLDEFVYEWGHISLTGRTESFDKVEAFRKNIEKLGWVRKAVVDSVKAAIAPGTVEFRMTIETAR
ncbi:MAG: hypothetical protein HY751_09005 [Nitrospinae bacterium]|nr:hypothetical protein [Nitrospinota bacterium]